MKYIDHIIGLSKKPMEFSNPDIINAYCFCLDSADAVRLLKRSILEGFDTRNVALRKVCKDMELDFLKHHESLIDFLIAEFNSVDPKKRQGLSYCLHVLSDSSPDHIRHRVQGFFINTKYVGVRRRAYKSLMKEDKIPTELIINTWKNFGDYECAWLIINKFPIKYLVEHRAELSEAIEEPWRLSKLYLKIGEVYPNLLIELKRHDGISYSYVMAKLGKTIPMKEAIEIIENNLSDDRLGLLIWSFGQLKNWQLLEYVEKQIPRINQLKIDQFQKKH